MFDRRTQLTKEPLPRWSARARRTRLKRQRLPPHDFVTQHGKARRDLPATNCSICLSEHHRHCLHPIGRTTDERERDVIVSHLR
ncbi:MAG: hypothetical protein V4521_12105, partial [Pseudomonadota bacterium]